MTTHTKDRSSIDEKRLEALGLSYAAQQLKAKKIQAKKLMLAYEHYRFVRQEAFDAFNQKLITETRGMSSGYAYKYLMTVPLSMYDQIPPASVLDLLEKAQALEYAPGGKVFDSYEVASIREVKDPILFGRIAGCTDRFFIADWGEDVKITDLLKENEG